MADFPEITILPDGNFLVKRGTFSDNQLLIKFLTDIIDEESLEYLRGFLSVTDDTDLIFGSTGLCG